MEQDRLLYKYTSFSRFIEMVEVQRLYLTNITLWEDPYEGYPVYTSFKEKNFLYKDANSFAYIKKKESLKSLYAQAWTYDAKESDAMWRIYSPDRLGVRITVALSDVIQCIRESLAGQFGHGMELKHYKVKYRDGLTVKKCLEKERQEGAILDHWICEYKRMAFSHEKEYRIACAVPLEPLLAKQCRTEGEKGQKVLQNIKTPPAIYYPISLGIFKEVLLDPRAPVYQEETFLAYCRKRSFKRDKVVFKKSELYHL